MNSVENLLLSFVAYITMQEEFDSSCGSIQCHVNMDEAWDMLQLAVGLFLDDQTVEYSHKELAVNAAYRMDEELCQALGREDGRWAAMIDGVENPADYDYTNC